MALLLPFILSTMAVVEPVGAFLPGGSLTEYDEHAPIRIESDEDFETGLPLLRQPNVEQGVRGGSGTPEDPYRIENWRIKEGGGGGGLPAIHISGTTKHVLVRNILLEPGNAEEKRTGIGAFVIHARNVRLENVDVGGMQTAFFLSNVQDVAIRSARVWGNAEVVVSGSRNVELRGLQLEGTGTEITWLSSSGRISDTELKNTSPDGLNRRGGTTKTRVGLSIGAIYPPSDGETQEPSTVEIERVHIINFTSFDPRQRPSDNPGLVVSGGSTVTIHESQFLNNDKGLVLFDSAVEVRDSLFIGNDIGIQVPGACAPCTIRGTEFADNGVHIQNTGAAVVDARENWWGSPDGPDTDRIEGPVAYRPWLDEGDHRDTYAAPALPGLLVVLAAICVGYWSRRRD